MLTLRFYRGVKLRVKRFKNRTDLFDYLLKHDITEYYLNGIYQLEV